MTINRAAFVVVASILWASFALAQTTPAPQPLQKLSAEETQSIATDAYIYFYPLVTMDLTRQQLTNVEKPEGISAPMNAFANVAAFPTADMKSVVRPNFDTLYSSGFLDLTKEPMVVSVPDTGGRYYLLPMLDMWTDVFASPGSRTTGTQAGNFLVAGPGWRPDLRERLIEEFRLPAGTQRIDAPTPYVWVIGRTKTDGPPDYEAVHKIQAGLQDHAAVRVGQNREASSRKDRSERRHEDAAEAAGRQDDGGQIFRPCGRTDEAASSAHHRPADHRADAADRHRAGQEP